MRRGKIEIIADILKIVKRKELTKTAIVYNANLNFKRANQYLSMLLSMELVNISNDTYSITDLGQEYLQKINELDSLFNNIHE
ncbi:MAG: winged helix-turn-helix domain-containing protein [Methanosarcinales archaeon]|nr:winged helix-turn-helix domain-containing protein [Methanosarcinales archaeon]